MYYVVISVACWLDFAEHGCFGTCFAGYWFWGVCDLCLVLFDLGLGLDFERYVV